MSICPKKLHSNCLCYVGAILRFAFRDMNQQLRWNESSMFYKAKAKLHNQNYVMLNYGLTMINASKFYEKYQNLQAFNLIS